ncbi:MAG: hypothetical protein AABW54_04450, partial [Candidatus Micrarchaeota archaeon]
GKLALRCAFKEIMKPFQYSGYKYFVYAVDDRNKPVAQPTFAIGEADSWRITNHWQANEDVGPSGTMSWTSCEDAIGKGFDVLTVAFPFRVPKGDALVEPNPLYGTTPDEPEFRVSTIDFEFRTCIWQSQNKRANPAP